MDSQMIQTVAAVIQAAGAVLFFGPRAATDAATGSGRAPQTAAEAATANYRGPRSAAKAATESN
jgi:hypothetical protein